MPVKGRQARAAALQLRSQILLLCCMALHGTNLLGWLQQGKEEPVRGPGSCPQKPLPWPGRDPAGHWGPGSGCARGTCGCPGARSVV